MLGYQPKLNVLMFLNNMTLHEQKIISPLFLVVAAMALSWLGSVYLPLFEAADLAAALAVILMATVALVVSAVGYWKGNERLKLLSDKVFRITLFGLAALLWLVLIAQYVFFFYDVVIVTLGDSALVRWQSKAYVIFFNAADLIDGSFIFSLLVAGLVTVAAVLSKQTKVKHV